MTQVALPVPNQSAKDLEEYVAAVLQCAGYFVEKRVVHREGDEILELDAIATSYEEGIPESFLAEAKSGNWGFPDIFKVVGWMKYLDIPKGAFFVSFIPEKKDLPLVKRVFAPLNLAVKYLDSFERSEDALSDTSLRPLCASDMLSIWRWSFLAERLLLEQITKLKNANWKSVGLKQAGPQEVLEYLNLVNHHIFFVPDVRERLARLYDAYKTHPKLSAGVACEIDGKPFDATDPPKGEAFRAAMFKGEHPAVQAAFYAEHRARLSIIKAAIDFVCLRDMGAFPSMASVGYRPAPDLDVGEAFIFKSMPTTFNRGLAELEAQPSFKKYALLWQVFLWGFGGFYLSDRKEEEFAWLSEATGVPSGEIPTALAVYDTFFAVSGSMCGEIKYTKIVGVKMMPAVFRGVGCLLRRKRYGIKEYRELGYGDRTVEDLLSWHNAFVQFVKG